MKGWTATLHQAADKALDELERLDPDNLTLALARSVFREAAAELDPDARPRGRPPSPAAALKRAEQAERRLERNKLDQEISRLYRSGLSMLDTAARVHVGIGRVKDGLIRSGVHCRPKGHHGGPTGTDMDRLQRIRLARSRKPPKTLEEIAQAEHISRERVRQICTANGIETQANYDLDARQLEAVNQYLAGDSLELVATQYAVGAMTVRGWLLRAGHQPRPGGRRHSPKVKARAERAAALYQRGWRAREIAAELGLSAPAMIYRYLALKGIRPNRQRHEARQ